MAKELNILIIITSQLSRKVEEISDKRPIINDFSNELSSILAYSNKILFLYCMFGNTIVFEKEDN